MIAYWEAGQKRIAERFTAETDRLVYGTSWGVAIANDPSGRNRQKWNRIRHREGRGSGGLTGAALESAVMALAALDSSLVKIVPAEGAQ